MTWKTIDSAPRDGTLVILGFASTKEMNEDGYGPVSLPGYWMAGYDDGVDYMGQDDGFVDCQLSFFIPPRTMGAEAYRYAGRQPTHWQPLPAPPTPEVKEHKEGWGCPRSA